MAKLVVWACAALMMTACGGAEFSGDEGEVFEVQTSTDPEPGELSSDQALTCGCGYLGSYDGRDYWHCPILAAPCIESP